MGFMHKVTQIRPKAFCMIAGLIAPALRHLQTADEEMMKKLCMQGRAFPSRYRRDALCTSSVKAQVLS